MRPAAFTGKRKPLTENVPPMPRRALAAVAAVKRRDPLARLGLLICLGLAAGIGVCGWLWWSATNAPRVHLTLFFRNTVHGVDVGSAVKILGVKVGQIEMMGVRLPTPEDPDHYAIVKVALEGDRLAEKGLPRDLNHEEPLRREIERGLRGRMQIVSPITGDLYLELEYKPDTKALLVAAPDEHIAEVPTLSDPLSEGIVAMTHRFTELEKQDFDRLEAELLDKLDNIKASLAPEHFADLNSATLEKLAGIRTALANPALRDQLAKINRDLTTFREAMAKLDTDAAAGPANVKEAMNRLRADLIATSAEADKIAAATDPRSVTLMLALANVSTASENATRVRRLCEEIISANALVTHLFLKTSPTEADAARTGAETKP